MGICTFDSCCQEYGHPEVCEEFHFIEENSSFRDEKLFLKSGKSIDNTLLLLSKKYFQVINDIKQNPTDFILQSKSYNLFDTFINLKSSNPFLFSENNKFEVISYLMECKEQISIIEKENEIKSIINNGNVNSISLMSYISIGNDVKQNIWYFTE